MGFFKKPVAPIDNDEEIRRAIRARVAKQAGIYDEEYIKTGKISGNKNAESAGEIVAPSHISAASLPIVTANKEGEAELSFEPQKIEPALDAVTTQQVKQVVPTKSTIATKPAKETKAPKEKKPSKVTKPPKEKKPAKVAKPPKEQKQKPAKGTSAAAANQRPKKKRKNIALILFIVVLLLAFIPLYYFLTGSGNQVPVLKASSVDNELLLTEPLLVRGIVSDSDDADGLQLFYSLDNGAASLLYTFEAGPGPFEYEIELPDTADFVGEHSVTLYAKDQKGELSESTVLNFTVVKPVLTSLTIIALPTKVKYVVGDLLDLTGLVVSAAYEDGKTLPITAFTSDIPNGTKLEQAGDVIITISYIEDTITKTITFNVTVAKATVIPTVRQTNTSYPVPSLEAYQAGPGAADLQWNELSGVNGYQIQRKTGSGGSWSTAATLSSGYTSWTDNGPTSGNTYYYRICSYKVVSGVKVFSSFSSAIAIAL